MVNDILHFGDDAKARLNIHLALLEAFGEDRKDGNLIQVGILPLVDNLHGNRLQLEIDTTPDKYAKFCQANKLEEKSMFCCLIHRH